MKIAIASGKGGTGKTSITCALAKSLDENIKLFDCDVEEPNVHIFFNKQKISSSLCNVFVPLVDQSKCNFCLKCEELCQFNAIVKIGDSMMVFPEMCHSCKGCKIICPENAIINSSKNLGQIKTFQEKNITVVYGELRIGEPMAPPLIDAVKNKIIDTDINIIDAPPGTSCPVISTIKNVDYLILVTEPTPFGLNDLVLAVETARILKVPFGIIINRADIGDNRISEYAKKENIEILMKIPNNRKIAESYSRGETMIKAKSELKKEFKQLYTKIITK
ncbi:MAG: (4Fe-4S)-binding protein [Desulfobacteraceae bacterium 4572_130]|nr:MAG: (4Fe-4S)-binding protein [Desulfobacteraceae bacterium 4572_130]